MGIPTESVKEDVDDESLEVTATSDVPEDQKGLVSRLGSGLWNYSSTIVHGGAHLGYSALSGTANIAYSGTTAVAGAGWSATKWTGDVVGGVVGAATKIPGVKTVGGAVGGVVGTVSGAAVGAVGTVATTIGGAAVSAGGKVVSTVTAPVVSVAKTAISSVGPTKKDKDE